MGYTPVFSRDWANSGTNQQWNIVKVSGQLYKIVNRNSGKALDINASTHSREPIFSSTPTAAATSRASRYWRSVVTRRPTERPSPSGWR
ncbi:RICIN domain-containing protein [Streptomyces canus]|uniref:RICIN domain-containing protein n=1 Tax=Streptomyces canus TaxID=58343 RepID=UPI0036EF9E34